MGRHTACSGWAPASGSGRRGRNLGSQPGLKPLPLGRAIPRRAPSVSRSYVIRFLVSRGSVLVLALTLSGCALTLDSSHLGVPVSLAGSAQRPDSGTPFRVTKRAVYMLLGLVQVSQPNLEDVLAGQVNTRPPVTHLPGQARSPPGRLPLTGPPPRPA